MSNLCPICNKRPTAFVEEYEDGKVKTSYRECVECGVVADGNDYARAKTQEAKEAIARYNMWMALRALSASY